MADPVQSDAPHSEGEVTAHPQAAGEREERLARPAATPASTENPLRRWVLIVLGVAALLFGYHLFAAVAQLEGARLDLVRTTVRAPADGLITNLELSVGEFAQAGAPVMTFSDTRSVWLVAELRERSLAHVRPGDGAAVAFDALPGQVFAAKVESIGWGIALPGGRGAAGLPGIEEEPGWVRGPQRFPVLLTFEDELPPDSVRVGSLAADMVHAGDNPVMHALAWLRMRLVSLLPYVV